MVDVARYQGKTHLLASTIMAICIDASPKRRLTSKEFKRGSLSRCKWDANQVLFGSSFELLIRILL